MIVSVTVFHLRPMREQIAPYVLNFAKNKSRFQNREYRNLLNQLKEMRANDLGSFSGSQASDGLEK